MKFKAKIRNFMGIGEADIDLTDRGLVLVQGENRDDPSQNSNGAGKSSFADAIFWCLYGTTARDGLKADEVVNNIAKKDCEVVVEALDDDGSVYTISRWRKHKGYHKAAGCSIVHKAKDGVENDLTGGTDALTQRAIDEAIGATVEVGQAVMYLGQEKLPNLPAMGDTDLKKLIEEAAGINVLMKAHERARERARAADKEYDLWRVNHSNLDRSVASVIARIDDLKIRSDGFETSKANSIRILDDNISAAKRAVSQRENDRDAISAENVQDAINKIDLQLASVSEEAKRETPLAEAYQKASVARTKIEQSFNFAVNQSKTAKAALDKVNERVGQPCGECGKPYCKEDIATAAALATEKVKGVALEALGLKPEVAAAVAAEEAAKKALEAFRASKTDTRPLLIEKQRLTNLLTQRATAERLLETEKAQLQRFEDQKKMKLAETNSFIEVLKEAEAEREKALEAYRLSEQKGAELEKAAIVAATVVKVYGPAGVRAHLLDEVTPLLNDRTANYLGVMSDGKISAVWSTLVADAKGDMKEKFSIAVEKEGAGQSFAALSGGEKRKVRLACAFALQDLVASRALKPLKLLICDEVDTALDVSGLERLMTVFEQKGREAGTVLVISHSDLRDWIRETTTVVMEGGRSTMTGALCTEAA